MDELFLNWTDDWQSQHYGQVPHAREVVDGHDVQIPDHHLVDIVRRLDAVGYIQHAPIEGRPLGHIRLTSYGKWEVQVLESRFDDVAKRRVACRDAVVAWLYLVHVEGDPLPSTDEFFADPRSYYLGRQFTAGDVNNATTYLAERGLIRGPRAMGGVHVRLALSAEGTDCAEQHNSSVVGWQRSRSGVGGSGVTITGSSQVLVNQNSPNARQTVANVQAPIDVDGATRFARQVLQMLPALGLPEAARAELVRAADALAAEAALPEPDQRTLRNFGGGILRLLESATGGALGNLASDELFPVLVGLGTAVFGGG